MHKHPLFLCLLNELLFALRAGNRDLAFAPGHTDLLPTAGTVIIPMLPILQLLNKLQIFPILLIPLVGIPGQHPENRPSHQEVIRQQHQQPDPGMGYKHGYEPHHHAGNKDRHIQLIAAIAAGHKTAKPVPEPP